MSRLSAVTALFVLVLLSLPVLHGQGSVGTLNGTVLDQAGASVPGATVVATNIATGAEATTTTTSSGTYTLPYLPAGTYNIRATAPGFRTATAEKIILRVAQTLSVDVKLEIGAVTEHVVVSSTPELLDTGSAEIGRYISTEEYKSWPILVDDGQRQIQSFIFTSLPGTTGGTFKGSINGGQQYSHEILIEGMPVGRSDLSGGNNSEFSPSAEAIGEFKLQSGAIGASYNGGQTAVANFTIKSGTNELHGSAFYYNQNEALNALSLQTKTLGGSKTKHRQDNYGYSVGGPVFIPKVYDGRNKTFFFTNFEKTSLNDLRFSGFVTLPTTSFKQGDFSRLLNPAYTGNPRSGTQVAADALNRPIIFGQIYDPTTTRRLPSGAIVRDPFQGNIIPEAKWDPVSRNVIRNIGIADPQFDTLLRNIERVGTSSPFFKLDIWAVKGDHVINENNQISGYYNHSYRIRNNNGAGRYLPIPGSATSSWQEQATPGNMARLSLTSTLTPYPHQPCRGRLQPLP